MSYTQGPWIFREPVGKRPPWEYVQGANGRPVCTVTQAGACPPTDAHHHASQAESEDNAKLIATAPRLLTELGSLVSAFDELCGLISEGLFDAAEDYVTANQDEQADAAHAAITKATKAS